MKLPSLNYRRKRGDLIQIFKSRKDLDRTKFDKFFCSQTNVYTRGHSAKIQKQTASTRQRSSFWSVRAVKDWNLLPKEVVSAPTLNSFKNRLDKHLQKEVFIHNT